MHDQDWKCEFEDRALCGEFMKQSVTLNGTFCQYSSSLRITDYITCPFLRKSTQWHAEQAYLRSLYLGQGSEHCETRWSPLKRSPYAVAPQSHASDVEFDQLT